VTRRSTASFFDRLRRASGLRILFLVATFLASQSALACAFDVASEPAAIGSPANGGDAGADTGDDCCSLCVGCTTCGGCTSVALKSRAVPDVLAILVPQQATKPPAVPPRSWTPPSPLRPPIALD
jgi:hypothetical protein